MNEVVSVGGTLNAVDRRGLTDILDTVDFGSAMLETRQPGPPVATDSAVAQGWYAL